MATKKTDKPKYIAEPVTVDGKVVPSVKLYMKDKAVVVQVLQPERTRIHGFGRFLEQYVPEEVQITEEARAALLKSPARRGLTGLEFFENGIIAWGDPSYHVMIPIGDVSVQPKAKDDIRNFLPVED